MRLAVLGLGFMGSTHLKALRNVPGAQLAAVMSGDERKLAGDLTAVAGNIGGPGEQLDFSGVKKYRALPELLADPEIDAVDICLPTDLHESTAAAALRAGKHVLVEKPMALDADSAFRMVEEGEKSGRILMVAQVLRFWPEYIALRDAVRGGALGPVRSAALRRRCAVPTWGGWLTNPARSGGGLFDLLIHDVDFCLDLFGAPEAVSATGWEETLRAQLHYGGGLTVEIEGGWYPGALPFSAEYSVVFDRDTIDFRPGGEPLKLPVPEGDGYAAEIGYFVECCRTGRPPELCPPRQSAAAVRWMRHLIDARQRKGEKLSCRI